MIKILFFIFRHICVTNADGGLQISAKELLESGTVSAGNSLPEHFQLFQIASCYLGKPGLDLLLENLANFAIRNAQRMTCIGNDGAVGQIAGGI